MTSQLLTVALCALLTASAHAFSKGAPASACGDMTPQHGTTAQKGKLPYDIKLSSSKVRAGDTVTLTIKGQGPEDTIRGLLVEARRSNEVVGRFQLAPNDSFLQLLDCNGEGTAVTHRKHTDSEDKRSVTMTWKAPSNFQGDVVFRATIAKTGHTYWVAEKSEPVSVV